MTAQERYKILLNIVAKVGIDGDVVGEFGRTMSALNGFQTLQEMNPPMPPQSPNLSMPTENQAVAGAVPPTGLPPEGSNPMV